jgi:glycosyltransferase involved in cell wall biosynthesis
VLFVGNDFERKGGPELLAVFERNLLPHCRLTIVSNSPALRTARVPSNVDIIAGVHDPLQLAQVYRASDLLVLPTKHDCYSHVICEAAAHGVPALATRVGGIGELLDESGGASLRPNCAPEEIASEIRQVLTHGYDWRAQTASQFARDKLTLELFERLVARALSHVGVVPLTPAASLVANR